MSKVSAVKAFSFAASFPRRRERLVDIEKRHYSEDLRKDDEEEGMGGLAMPLIAGGGILGAGYTVVQWLDDQRKKAHKKVQAYLAGQHRIDDAEARAGGWMLQTARKIAGYGKAGPHEDYEYVYGDSSPSPQPA